MSVNIHQAKTHFSKLVARAEQGEEIIIARGDKPVVKIVAINPPVCQPKPRRQGGWLKDKIALTESFFEPLPEEELALWNGEKECECVFCSTPTP